MQTRPVYWESETGRQLEGETTCVPFFPPIKRRVYFVAFHFSCQYGICSGLSVLMRDWLVSAIYFTLWVYFVNERVVTRERDQDEH